MNERLMEILRAAVRFNVTDIHFGIAENSPQKVIIEMRVDGKIRQLKAHPDDMKLFHYLMYRANLDLSAAMEPQTGRFEETVDGTRLSLRFALVSSYYVTSGVLRILNAGRSLSVRSLTNDPDTADWLEGITSWPSGLFVFSGPTSSGKTTSLYTILNACEDKRIFTLEDPVEIVNERYVQLQINEKRNFTYDDGLRQLMRHDPDIIMIGEVRDSTTAKMAVRSALTGHLVVTSLHSFSCVSAIDRLLDLGVQEYQLQDVLTGISNQRLFDCPEGGRTGVYEWMDRKEVEYYFKNGRTSPQFRTLADGIRQELAQGTIDHAQAEAQLSGL